MSTRVADVVVIQELDDQVPHVLHCHYPDELEMQPCYVELDLESGLLSAGYNPEVDNKVPREVFCRRTLRWDIPCLTSAAANELLREVEPFAERVLAGASIVWDGENHIGQFDGDAAAAREEVADLVARPDRPTVGDVDAGDWFGGEAPENLTADTDDDALAAIARNEEQLAATTLDVYTVLLGAEQYLTERREALRDEVRDELETVAEQHKDLEEQRNALIVRVKAFGDSDRQVGGRAGMTHTAVQYIVAKQALAEAAEVAPVPLPPSDLDRHDPGNQDRPKKTSQ